MWSVGLGRVRVIREQREVKMRIHVPERLNLEVLDLRACARGAREERGHHDHGAGLFGHAVLELDPRQAPRPRDTMHPLLDDRGGELARGQEPEQADPRQERLRSPRNPRIGHGRGRGQRGEERDRPEIKGDVVPEDEAAEALLETGDVRDVELEVAPSGADQVVPDVPTRILRPPLPLPGALDRAERHAKLGLPGRLGQLLDRLPVAIPASEVHPSVDAGGIALEHLLHEAHSLDRAVPVGGGDQPEPRDRIPHGSLPHRLALMLARSEAPRSAARAPACAERGGPRTRSRGSRGEGAAPPPARALRIARSSARPPLRPSGSP